MMPQEKLADASGNACGKNVILYPLYRTEN